jgi:hypothetical protein
VVGLLTESLVLTWASVAGSANGSRSKGAEGVPVCHGSGDVTRRICWELHNNAPDTLRLCIAALTPPWWLTASTALHGRDMHEESVMSGGLVAVEVTNQAHCGITV